MTEQQLLEKVAGLPPEERAAAIAHLMYCEIAEEFGWSVSLPKNWSDLDEKTRSFNIASARKWAKSPRVLSAWIEALGREKPRRGFWSMLLGRDG
jgi:hypothetical protein